MDQNELLQDFDEIMSQNIEHKCYIGQGYYKTFTPVQVKRYVLENPKWYTAYTPYQSEISQGRLEMLHNFQVMLERLTGLSNSNCSLLDEANSAIESMLLAQRYTMKKYKNKNIFLLDSNCFDHIKQSIHSTADQLNIKVLEVNWETLLKQISESSLSDKSVLVKEYLQSNFSDINSEKLEKNIFGALFQTPNSLGEVFDFEPLSNSLDYLNCLKILGSDLMFAVSGKNASEMNMDICYGSAQRFGVPMNYGGPHASFLTFKQHLTRFVPGRIITLAKDTRGELAYRMGIQTREQHIKREAATSNVCTAQALLAIANAFYVVYHGENGLKKISRRINTMANYFAQSILLNQNQNIKLWQKYDQSQDSFNFYDTVVVETNDSASLYKHLLESRISANVVSDSLLSFSFDETTSQAEIDNLISVIFSSESTNQYPVEKSTYSEELQRCLLPVNLQNNATQNNLPLFKTHDIFNKIKGEHELMRYISLLESKDISLCNSMISLGSCTMKLNSAVEMDRLFAKSYFDIHPFTDTSFCKGYLQMISELGKQLCLITEMEAISFMSNSGATGEYLGIMAIDRYHKNNGDFHRNVCLIPSSAHGTNPASAAKCGLKIVTVKNAENGSIDLKDLHAKVDQYKDNLSLIMMTYPSTFGVYETGVREIIDHIHDHGGLVYMDGANLNAQLGITSPGYLGADVCHLNLHKTFCIPHGGGGPGMGPICFKANLLPHVTSHSKIDKPIVLKSGEFIATSGQHGITSAPFSSASILSISYLYIRALGFNGLRNSSLHAMLNANYLAKKIGEKFPVKYGNKNGLCAHEFIIDFTKVKDESGITEEDIAKRLMDFGFHAPTMSWPVPKTMMVEPTESENLQELDRFIDVFHKISEEIESVKSGEFDKLDNPLKNAPHPVDLLISKSGAWEKPYSIEQAYFPLSWIKIRGKFWPSVGRIDNVGGDRKPIFEKHYKDL